MKLGSVGLLHPTIMYNILGPKNFKGRYKTPIINFGNAYLKMYGKLESKPKRKIGHVNLVDQDEIGIEKLLVNMSKLQENIIIEPDSTE